MVEQKNEVYDNSTIKQELSANLEDKVIEHRDQYYSYLISHYAEIVLNLRKYKNAPASLDTVRMEYLLRNGYQVIIGQNRAGKICLLGYANAFQGYGLDISQSFVERYVNPKEITWIVPKKLIPKNPQPITRDDDAETGDYITLTNKAFTFVNDFNTIEMYAKRIAEIQGSRYSLIIQSKISTVFQFNNGDETANQAIEKLYNGTPFLKVDSFFSPGRQVLHMGGSDVITALEVLKTAYKEEVDELNNQLGINSVGIQKDSGVSSDEAKSNNEYVQNATAIYTTPINRELHLLNTRFGTEIFAYMNSLTAPDAGDNNEND